MFNPLSVRDLEQKYRDCLNRILSRLNSIVIAANMTSVAEGSSLSNSVRLFPRMTDLQAQTLKTSVLRGFRWLTSGVERVVRLVVTLPSPGGLTEN